MADEHVPVLLDEALGALAGQPADQFHQQADLLITLLDPCVGYRLRLH